ncbi:hypothetical protein ACVWZK_008342 [Bradyrhizobium sp. GM0.4]
MQPQRPAIEYGRLSKGRCYTPPVVHVTYLERFAADLATFRTVATSTWTSESHGKGAPISWYQDYNTSKHDRHDAFKKANLKNLILSVAGLLVIVTSQFGAHDFGAGTPAIVWSNGYQPMRASIGELFRVNYPTDWAEDEIYNFNWSDIKDQPNRFGRIDFDAIPA